ncbi:hypothetical protein QAD02_016748 [Eretmocerus hayati]|uniref:Uncharacterized protein n=1 Tax=Eretmocerus hayati TaxID=131215 RepID=A0ACC2PBX6_9HYME|nr:hypothetical protein QAD02_016748 [Eretmocerus hayati]
MGNLLNCKSKECLYKVIRPAFYLTRLFGMAPYSLPEEIGTVEQQSSRALYAYSLIPLCIYTFMVGRTISHFKIPENFSIPLDIDRDSQWSKFFFTCCALIFSEASLLPMLVNYFVLLVELIMSIVRHKAIMSVWISILEFDQSVGLTTVGKTKGTSSEDSLVDKFKLYMWSIALISISGWSVISGTSMTTNFENIVDHFSYMLPYYGTYIAVFQFCGLAFLIGQRFKYLNESVQASVDEGSSKSNNLQFIKMKELVHNSLIEASETLNQVYSWSLILYIFSKFCHTINNLYAVLRPDRIKSIKGIFCLTSWASMSTFELWALHFVCEYTSEQANRFQYVLSKWHSIADARGLCVSLQITYCRCDVFHPPHPKEF